MRVRPAIIAAAQYVACVFLIGFMLGVVRTLVIAPRTGALVAVGIELPFMLGASALLARLVVRRQRLATWQDRAIMGGGAFLMLMAIEATLALVMGIPLTSWLASLGTPAGLLGLAGQLGFAAMPLAFQPASRFN